MVRDLATQEKLERDRIRAKRRKSRRYADLFRRAGFWTPPSDPTPVARQIYRWLYGDPWPRGWIVRWSLTGEIARGKMNVGNCDRHDREIALSLYAACCRDGEVLRTLIHEFTHMRWPRLRHGKDFERIVDQGYRRLVGEKFRPLAPRDGLDVIAWRQAGSPIDEDLDGKEWAA